MRHRLFLQVYLTILAALAVLLIGAGAAWRYVERSRAEHVMEATTEYLTANLPPASAPQAAQQRVLRDLRSRMRVDVALYAPDGSLIAAIGRAAHGGMGRMAGPHFSGPPGQAAWVETLPDGRWFVLRLPHRPWRPGLALVGFIGVLGLAVAAGAWPVARSLTRRLERLRAGVEQLGQGDLSARVAVEGRDEIAGLAASFNRAAARIEELVGAHRLLLANASHELRTPLARIRMALELAGEGIDATRRANLQNDIAELDQLIGEILLASRLDAQTARDDEETVDFLALAAEEAARDGIDVDGTPVSVRGDPTLLRRMIRNLIENARRHAGDKAPEIRVGWDAGMAVLDVRDHGPGVPAAEREKIFTPLYRIAGSAESGRGSGLGLALVRQIAARHHGTATCLPAAPGTLFRITLPAASTAR